MFYFCIMWECFGACSLWAHTYMCTITNGAVHTAQVAVCLWVPAAVFLVYAGEPRSLLVRGDTAALRAEATREGFLAEAMRRWWCRRSADAGKGGNWLTEQPAPVIKPPNGNVSSSER